MQARSKNAVFLDRDGVLNHVIMRDGKPRSPLSLAEFKIADDAEEALRALRAAGYLLIVVTNQPEVSRGIQKRVRIDAMHAHLMSTLPLDDIRVCFHDTPDRCRCRKPEPGLLNQAGEDWGVRMEGSFMIGDRDKDIEAGRSAGCKTILLRQEYNRECRDEPDHCVGSLIEAAHAIIATLDSARSEAAADVSRSSSVAAGSR